MANKQKQQDSLARIFAKQASKQFKLKQGESLTPGPGLSPVREASYVYQGLSGASGGTTTRTVYGKAAPSAAAPAPPPVAPAPPPEPRVPQVEAAPITAPGNPELSIPGVDVRLTGENVGIKAKRSKARSAGTINSGTNRLTIPRSSGANSLNIG